MMIDSQTEPIARKQIPDAWAQSGHCPACQAAPLQVVHLANANDYLICNQCEVSFEVATVGAQIRIKNPPEKLGFMENELRYHWIEPSVLSGFLNNRVALMREKTGGGIPGSLLDQEVLERSESLYKMGNKPKMVEFILVQAGATTAQAQAAFVRLKERSERDAKKLARNFRVAGGTIFLVSFALFAAWALTPIVISTQLRQQLGNPTGAANRPNLFLKVLNILPNGIKPGYLKSAPPQVRFVGPGSAQCPRRSAEAAALFGGAANRWALINRGWQMTNTDAPSTIRIPQDMYVAFVDSRAGAFSTTTGPATISNVNFVAILCN